MQSLLALVLGIAAAGVCYALIWSRLKPVSVVAMPVPSPTKATGLWVIFEVLTVFSLWK